MGQDLPFQLGQRLSEGAFASIYLCRERESTSAEVYAIKLIDKSGIIESGRQTSKQIDGEVKLHKLCGSNRNSNVIDFLAADETPTGFVWICMEFASGGDLFDKIEPDLGVDEDVAQLYFKQLLAGLSFIHAKGVSHRDIKPENILLDADGNLKIADFGLAALYQYQGKRRMLNTCCGSPPYAAPEIVSSYDGEKVDVWSAGVVLFALCLGSTPWNEPTGQCSLFKTFVRSRGLPQYEPWDRLGSEVFDLLQRMFAIEPSKRYTLLQVESHPWVRRVVEIPNPLDLANKLMSKLQVDLSRAPAGSQRLAGSHSQGTQTSLSQQMDRDQHQERLSLTQVAQEFRVPLDFLEDDPALSQYTGSTQLLESLTQKARRFADITGSERLTRFFSLWPVSELMALLISALTEIGIAPSAESESSIRIKALDTTGCQLLGHFNLHKSQNEMIVAEFTKQKGDPQQWRRLFKIIAYQVREAIYTG